MNPVRAFLFLMAAHVFFVLMDAIGKALSRDMGIPLITLVRHGGHTLLMLAVFAPSMGRNLLKTARPGLQIARGLVLGAFTLCHFTALSYLPQAEATAILFIAPFCIMLLAGPLLGERVTWARWAGAAGGFLGMLLVVRPGSNLPLIGVAFAMATMLCNIAFQLMTRMLAMSDDANATVFMTSLVALAVSGASMPWQVAWGGWPATLSDWHYLLFAVLAVAGVASQFCLVRAYRYGSASFIAPLIYLQLFWAMAAGWMFFGQLPGLLTFAGMALILVSGIGAVLVDSKRKPAA